MTENSLLPVVCGRLLGDGRTRGLLALVALMLAIPTASPAAAASPPLGTSIVAQATGPGVSIYRSPYATKPFLRLTNPTPEDGPLVFLVISRVTGWDHVWVPVRPDETTGWIRASSVSLSSDPYQVRVSLGSHRITVYDGTRVVMRRPAGVGRSVLPTPHGTYFLTMLLKQPDPTGMYGPYAFGTSAYSNVLYSFGGGPGQIGLHGTDDPAGLGTNVSHGCIRVSDTTITTLARMLPLGTPVVIGP